MNRRRLYANSIAAVVQVVVAAGLLFELYRFLLRQLGSDQIGAWSLVLAIVSIASIAEFGIGGSVLRFAAGDLGSGNREKAAATVGLCAATASVFVGLSYLLIAPIAIFILNRVITDPALLASALGLLPWALASVWIGTIGRVMQSALDACQRSDLRAGINLAGAVAQLVTVYHLVPEQGLAGVGPSWVAQAVVIAVLSMGAVLLVMKVPVSAWVQGDMVRLRETLRYGRSVQIIAITQMIFDPAVKLLLSVVDGLSATGLYEVANKAVLQFRSVIVSAFQMLVPFMAHRIGGSAITREEMAQIYKSVQGILVVLTVPFYALVAGLLPAFLTLWIGHYDPAFVTLGLICLAGWAANTLIVSSYMISMATGQLDWLVRSHLLIGLGSMALGYIAGLMFGGLGVVTGSMTGLAVGSAIVPIWFHKHYGVSARDFLPASSWPLIIYSLSGAAILLVMQVWLGTPHISWWLVTAYGVFALGCAVLVLRHPVTIRLMARKGLPNRPPEASAGAQS